MKNHSQMDILCADKVMEGKLTPTPCAGTAQGTKIDGFAG